jgi:hypothetical protein
MDPIINRRTVGTTIAGVAAGLLGGASLANEARSPNHQAGAAEELMAYQSVQNAGSIAWITASGDTTGATDVAAINGQLAAGAEVHLEAGAYYINAPINVPYFGILLGPPASRSELYGAVINVASGFSGSGAIVLGQGAVGTSDGYLVDGVVLNGNNVVTAGGPVHGIYAYGVVHAAVIRHVGIKRFSGDGVHADVDASDSSKFPYSWTLMEVESAHNAGNGFYGSNMTDMDYLFCRAVFNTLDGFATNPAYAPGANSQYIGCKAEENRMGWNLQGGASAFAHVLVGCSTQSNNQHGFHASGTNTAGLIQIIGCRFMTDGYTGTASSPYAGIFMNNLPSAAGLMVSGTSVLTNNVPNTTTTNPPGMQVYPQHGLWLASVGGHARVSGSQLLGSVSAYRNDGGNASVVISADTGQATGPMYNLTWTVA